MGQTEWPLCLHCKTRSGSSGRGLCHACYDRPALRKRYPKRTGIWTRQFPPCRHCQKQPGGRPRGLCYCCYNIPAIRARYPSTSKYGRRSKGDFNGKTGPATQPTIGPPGSVRKQWVMRQRAEAGVSLFHPDDATSAMVESRDESGRRI